MNKYGSRVGAGPPESEFPSWSAGYALASKNNLQSQKTSNKSPIIVTIGKIILKALEAICLQSEQKYRLMETASYME